MLGHDNLIQCLVADTGPLIKNIKFDKLASRVITTPDVSREIRDHNTRHRLQLLPFDIETRVPSEDSLKFVNSFAKETGDIRSLSTADVSVIALTYEMEMQLNGGERLRQHPVNEIKINEGFGDDHVTNLAGFYVPKNKPASQENSRTSSMCLESSHTDIESVAETLGKCELSDEWQTASYRKPTRNIDPGSEELSDYVSEESDDDGGDWIGPSNIDSKKTESVENIKVACTTTDFAIQNVLLQIGLHVVSIDGMLIKYAKKYVLKCYGCFNVSEDCTRQFCSQCGHKTLEKVAITIDENGVKWYQRLSKKERTKRGKRYSLPNPKGGRQGNNSRQTADQVKYKNNFKLRSKVDVLSSEFVTSSGPFAPTNVDTKAFTLRETGQRSGFRGNPNERRKNTGNRKSKKK